MTEGGVFPMFTVPIRVSPLPMGLTLQNHLDLDLVRRRT